LSNEYSIWEMHADGSYTRREGDSETNTSCQQALIDHAQARFRDSTRLKRRKTQAVRRRNIESRS